MHTIAFACHSDPGRTHSENQDRWLADPESGLFVVTDGMGVAEPAQLVVDVLSETIPRELADSANSSDAERAERVSSAVSEVSRRIYAKALEEEAGWLGLGATLALALIHGGRAVLAHLGDSRIYLHHQGRLTALTRDHSLVEELIGLGKLARDQVNPRAFNGGPTRYAGMADEAVAEAQMIELKDGDRLLLCTDGLPSMLDDVAIEGILNARSDLEATCRALVDAANEAGGEDNVTVVLIEAIGCGPSTVGEPTQRG